MKEWGPIRTALFVPGNRPDRVDKAVGTGADVVIIDLEDAVPPSQKEESRSKVREKIAAFRDREILVRVNAIGSEFLPGDLDEIIVDGLSCIIVPKVEERADIREIDGYLGEAERRNDLEPGTISVIPLIESARAVQNVFEILSEKTDPRRLFTAAFGAADYTLDMGAEITREGAELHYPRSRIAVACRAAGVDPPLDTPFMIDVKDVEALKTDARRARQLGFQGKLCIHPIQIEPCHAVFSPTAEEIEHAARVIQAFEDAEARGIGAIQLDGKFIDAPIVERSRRIVKLAAAIGSRDRGVHP
jgi:citrate lyase subunit beta/citryl-CoA lyase